MKVLIVSHNCFSTTQNMGKTLASFFELFNKEELMQLYFYPSLPNTKVCENYFRITDKDILNSIVQRKSCGRKIMIDEINEENQLFESVNDAQTYSEVNRNSNIVRRMRDIMWGLGNWKTSVLKEWLNEGKPDVIFYALGDATFSQNIAMWIADYLHIPLITYVCDEFYFTNKTASLNTRIINHSLIKNIFKIQKKASLSISICDALGEKYFETFGTPYITIMTGTSFENEECKDNYNCNQISYIGNLGLERWKSLLDIASVIEKFNKECNFDYQLVYYGKRNENLENIVKYGGYLSNQAVKETMKNSFMLIHTETFNEKYTNRLMYSVSTKIADSLASGVPILAYGPKNLASMQHLIKNKAAFCVTNKDELYDELKGFITNASGRKNVVENALKTATQYHSIKNVGALIKKAVEQVVEK